MRDIRPHIKWLANTTEPDRRAALLLMMATLTADRAMDMRTSPDKSKASWWTAAIYLILADVENSAASAGQRKPMTLVNAVGARGGDRDRLLADYVAKLAAGRVTHVLHDMAKKRSLQDRQTMLVDLRNALRPIIGAVADTALMTIAAPGYVGWRPTTRTEQILRELSARSSGDAGAMVIAVSIVCAVVCLAYRYLIDPTAEVLRIVGYASTAVAFTAAVVTILWRRRSRRMLSTRRAADKVVTELIAVR